MQQNIDNYDFNGKRALIRVDFNVPLDKEGKVSDATRIKAAIPTIQKVLQQGGSVILMSHMGRPKEVDSSLSLKQIVYKIEEFLGVKVSFADDCMRAQTAVSQMKNGDVLLLENLRFYAEEEGKPRFAVGATEDERSAAKTELKRSQQEFVKTLASYGDCYINDAFGTAHRAHASTALIAEYFPNDKMFGYLMDGELKAIDRVMKDAQRPFTAIVGGAKVSSKITVIENLMQRVDNLIICGGMVFTFQAAMGGKVGRSLCEEDQFPVALNIISKAKEQGVNIYFGEDAVCSQEFKNESERRVFPLNDIPDGWMGLDVGPKTSEIFANVLKSSKTILWNGPAGVFEMENFRAGSLALGEAVVEATSSGAFSLIGGGDTVACVNMFGMADKVSYVSTGGGALLEYMEGKELPGVAAIRD